MRFLPRRRRGRGDSRRITRRHGDTEKKRKDAKCTRDLPQRRRGRGGGSRVSQDRLRHGRITARSAKSAKSFAAEARRAQRALRTLRLRGEIIFGNFRT